MKLKVKTRKVKSGPRGNRKSWKETTIFVVPGLFAEFFTSDFDSHESISKRKYAYASIAHERSEPGVYELRFWYQGTSQPDPGPKEASEDGIYEWIGATYRNFTKLNAAIVAGKRGVYILNGKKRP